MTLLRRLLDLIAAAIPILLLSSSLYAQGHADVVASVKNEMGSSAFTSNDAMLGFVLRVIEHLPPAEGIGLVKAPPGAENAAFYGPANAWVRVNRVIEPNGQIIKILTDSGASPASGNGPAWNFDDIRPDLYVRVMASAPPPVYVPPPVIVPPPTPSVDYSTLLQQILELQRLQLEKADANLTIAKDTNAHVVSMDRTLTQTLGSFSKFAAKYIGPALATWYVTKQMTQPAAVKP